MLVVTGARWLLVRAATAATATGATHGTVASTFAARAGTAAATTTAASRTSVLRAPMRRLQASARARDGFQTPRPNRSKGIELARKGREEPDVNKATMHTVTFADKICLVVTLKYAPGRVPPLVRRGTINTAYSHFRILSATLTMLVMLYISELAIRAGREARDGGEECLYKDAHAQQLQAAKREQQARARAEKAAREAEERRRAGGASAA